MVIIKLFKNIFLSGYILKKKMEKNKAGVHIRFS